MTNKTSGLPSALKIIGISTIVVTVIVTLVIIISAISNEAEALGMLVGAGTLIVGVFLGLMEIAAAELLSIQQAEVSPKSAE
jgi:high-affinity nickel permease